MKKRVLTIICCCFFLALPAVSFGGMYGSFGAGVAMLSDSDVSYTGGSEEWGYETGYIIGGAIGYMMETFRVEGELSYMATELDTVDGVSISPMSVDVSALTFLVNGYFDIDTGTSFTPFITAGIGMTRVEADMMGILEYDDTVFAYQIGVGAGFAVSETVTLDCSYRYFGAADAEFTDPGGTADVEVASHNFIFGVRVQFN